jgi:hypothetical protein
MERNEVKRRSYLKSVLGCVAVAGAGRAQSRRNPIVLHVDLSVDPAQEQEMLQTFHLTFKPAAMKQPGYIDVKMCKLESALQGNAPSELNYRFQLIFESEQLRQQWVASATHKRVWPMIEGTLKSRNYTVLLFESV